MDENSIGSAVFHIKEKTVFHTVKKLVVIVVLLALVTPVTYGQSLKLSELDVPYAKIFGPGEVIPRYAIEHRAPGWVRSNITTQSREPITPLPYVKPIQEALQVQAKTLQLATARTYEPYREPMTFYLYKDYQEPSHLLTRYHETNLDHHSHSLSLLTACTVTTTADSGPGSLRQCLIDATQGTVIDFDTQTFPPTTPATITLQSPLPWIVTDTLVIDGSTAGIILDGGGLSEGSGFVIIDADGVVVRGLQILNFPEDGIVLGGGTSDAVIGGENIIGTLSLDQGNIISNNGMAGIWIEGSGTISNRVIGNYIGTDVTGMIPQGNTYGVVIIGEAAGNIIGGSTRGMRNVISGNSEDGIAIQHHDTKGNRILGNFIGTNISGTVALGNGSDGVFIGFGAVDNFVGSETSGIRNIISGNNDAGIKIHGDGTSSNKIQGNYIGTDVSGMIALGNNTMGVLIQQGAQNNIVGGNITDARNIISGNAEDGIRLVGSGTNDNQVMGNYIGINVSGITALGNGSRGISIVFGAGNNTIGGNTTGTRNIISGNKLDGILLQGEGTAGNHIQGNYVGTDAGGSMGLGNGATGVVVMESAASNIIGGKTTETRNIISGNTENGIKIQDGTSDNQIWGNYIGVDATGLVPLGNKTGISILGSAKNNVIGGTMSGERNIISGNDQVGVMVQDEGTTGNQVLGNYIGTDTSGTALLGNGLYGILIWLGAANNTIGGDTSNARNVISGNNVVGVFLARTGTTGNKVSGNFIGTNISGTIALGNGSMGVVIIEGATENIIGGSTSGERNIISGNVDDGVHIEDSETISNQIIGNYIGVDVTGMLPLGNGEDGVFISSGARNNIIGGNTSNARNVIGGNKDGIVLWGNGTTGNQVLSNYIGIGATGSITVGNKQAGVLVGNGATNNIIGGATSGTRNVISGNVMHGIVFQDVGTTDNHALGNYIGTDAWSLLALGNGSMGIVIMDGSKNNIIGGAVAGAGNIISGNTGGGIQIQGVGTTGNQVMGNYIGTNVTGTVALSNGHGILVQTGAASNQVGGVMTETRNIISGNSGTGVLIQGVGTTGNQVLGNYIGTGPDSSSALGGNNLAGIAIAYGAQNNTCSHNVVSGNAGTGVQIQNSGTTNNQIMNNHIGTDVTGTRLLGNSKHGVAVFAQASNNNVGVGNLISSNGGAGVWLQDVHTEGNKIIDNDILTNTLDGIFIGNRASQNRVGAGNLVRGNNGAGVWIQNADTIGNEVVENDILYNVLDGIRIIDGASDNTIGISNTIIYNGSAGVYVETPTSQGNTISRNTIHHNVGLPIELDPTSIEPTPLEGYSPSTNVVWGSACPNCNVEIYANPNVTPAGTIYLGEANAMVSGIFSLTLSSTPSLPCISYTMTDQDGTTSEFSSNLCHFKAYLPLIARGNGQ